ncbi:cob(I)yrinic acid a,c-diamide adenosyltransferase [Candidatus Micrarchaeota archaeon]|nr:cob(I)yrinic acid a,c-diamide adenosyltransferase [Candidatus Micrarchaeota archaeon]
MTIYTKAGDKGQTTLFTGKIVEKDDERMDAYGTVDELNSFLGLAKAEIKTEKFREMLDKIQADLFVIGAEVAESDKNKKINYSNVSDLEKWIDETDKELAPLDRFIIPDGAVPACTLHIARTVCRRAERKIVSLNKKQKINEFIMMYLNRLSDLLFVMARGENSKARVEEKKWKGKITV